MFLEFQIWQEKSFARVNIVASRLVTSSIIFYWGFPLPSSTPSTLTWRNPKTQDPLRTSLNAWSFMTKWRMAPWCWESWNTSSCLLVNIKHISWFPKYLLIGLLDNVLNFADSEYLTFTNLQFWQKNLEEGSVSPNKMSNLHFLWLSPCDEQMLISPIFELSQMFLQFENQAFSHFLYKIGEKLEREEVDILIKECCDPEDDDGFIPYERKKMENHNKNNTSFIFSIFEKSVRWPSSRNVRRLVIAECDIPKY